MYSPTGRPENTALSDKPTDAVVVLLIGIYLILLSACSTHQTRTDDSMPEHYTDDGYRNLYVDPKEVGFFSYVRMRYFGKEEWADYEATADRVPTVDTPVNNISHPSDQPQITWIGHATVLVQYQNINVLTDPHFSERASPFSFMGPKRAVPPSITIDQLPKIDFILISHNHYDHLDAYTVETIGNRATWLVPLGQKSWFIDAGVTNVVEFDWWDEHTIANARITATPSQHWSGRGLTDRYQTLWASWAVQIGEFNFWFGGDTGYNTQIFTEIGDRLGPFDLGLIPVGGYDPRWFMKDMHVNPEEAVKLHRDIRANFSLGIHWGAFPLTAEPIDEPPHRLREAAQSLTDSAFVTYPVGKTVHVPVE